MTSPADFRINTSSTGARGNALRTSNPTVASLGRSFALCTAMSIPPASNARSISPVKSPLRPARGSIGSAFRSSPRVVIVCVLITRSGDARCSVSTAMLVCARASSLPREPKIIDSPALIERRYSSEGRSAVSSNGIPGDAGVSPPCPNRLRKSAKCSAMISSAAAICRRRSASDCCAMDCSESMS